MRIDDKPMYNCGMVLASEFSTFNRHIFPQLFAEIEVHQREFRRNCAMVTLSKTQVDAIKAAEEAGFKEVFEFPNPNSGHKIGIYVKTLWKNYDEFEADVNKGSRNTGTFKEKPYILELHKGVAWIPHKDELLYSKLPEGKKKKHFIEEVLVEE